MRIIYTYSLLLLLIASNANADVVRVFKRTSDDLVKTMSLQGPGIFPRTPDEDFILLYGSLEPYELAVSNDKVPGDVKEIDILPNGSVKYTEFTQVEIDARQENVLKRQREADRNQAKAKLRSGQPLTQTDIDSLFPN